MKKILGLLTVTSFCVYAQAQTFNYLKYKCEIKYSTMKLAPVGVTSEFEYKANKDYGVFCTHNIRRAVTQAENTKKMFDFTNGIIIDTAVLKTAKRYSIETIDTIYSGNLELEEQTQTPSKTIGRHICRAFKVKNEQKRGVFVPLSNYTIWIDKEAKVNPNISSLLLSYMLVDGFGKCSVKGLVVQVDFEQKKYSGSYTLVKSDEQEMPNSEVILPWKDDNFTPAVPCNSVIINEGKGKVTYVGLREIKYEENPDAYIERKKKLFYKVTGKKVEYFLALNGNLSEN